MERTMVITSQKVEIWGPSNILCGYVSICIQFWLELHWLHLQVGQNQAAEAQSTGRRLKPISLRRFAGHHVGSHFSARAPFRCHSCCTMFFGAIHGHPIIRTSSRRKPRPSAPLRIAASSCCSDSDLRIPMDRPASSAAQRNFVPTAHWPGPNRRSANTTSNKSPALVTKPVRKSLVTFLMKKIDIEKKMHGKLNYVIDFLYNIYIYIHTI